MPCDGIKKLYERQRRVDIDYRFGSTANCVVNMVSPEMYVEHMLPFDPRLRSEFESFGLHNCAWLVDPYMEPYSHIPDERVKFTLDLREEFSHE